MEPSEIGGPFSRISWESINLNSSDQCKAYFLKHGWRPVEWNYKKDPKTKKMIRDDKGQPILTSPKLTEDSFDSIEGDLPKLLARRNVLVHRRRMLKNTRKTDDEETGLINLVRSDGRIGAGGFPNGTPTGRVRHRNVVNIPGSDAIYGPEIRSLFIVPEGYTFLGVDAQALEARIMSHYLLPYPDGDKIADILLNQDVHQINADLWGCTRKEAKSPYYALGFGAQPPKIASTMGISLERAQKIFDDYWDFYKPITLFKEDLVKTWESRGGKNGGYLKGPDGRKLFGRSPHSLVNLMVQGTGAIAVKVAVLFANKVIQQQGLDCRQLLFVHDEINFEVRDDKAELAKVLVEQSFLKAGEFFKLRVPLVGVGLLGENWHTCH